MNRIRAAMAILGVLASQLALASTIQAPWLGEIVADRVVTGSSPDNNFELVRTFYGSARESIKISVYELENVFIGEALEEALDRGVKIQILLEGSPIPKLATSELYIVSRLAKLGAEIYFYDLAKGRNKRAFKYFHNKYGIVDGRRVIVGSANYGTNGHPVNPTAGNREWEIVIEDAAAARLFEQAFAHDLALKEEWVEYGAQPKYTFNEPGFVPDRSERKGKYDLELEAIEDHNVGVQTVFAPDNALDIDGPILGNLKSAKKSILVQQLNFETYWGDKNYNPEREDSPMMKVILAAARAGRMIRILLNDDFVFRDPTLAMLFNFESPLEVFGFDTQEAKEPRDNRATVDYLRRVTRREGLDVIVRLLNFKRCGLGVLHNKGMIIDDRKTMVGSLNWGESALKFNREAGVVVESRAVAGYYKQAFDYDWHCSR